MNIIRKHWGILLCGIVFLGLLGYLLFSTFKERQAYAATQASIQEQQNWFKNVNKDGWRIKKSSNGELENASIAERNREMTVGRYQEVTEDLYRRYAINPELPPNASRAREMLDQQLGVRRSSRGSDGRESRTSPLSTSQGHSRSRREADTRSRQSHSRWREPRR